MMETILPQSSHSRQARKAKLVDLGIVFLARGEWEWGMIAAITTIIRARGWQNA
jgi:hypothetical protein